MEITLIILVPFLVVPIIDVPMFVALSICFAEFFIWCFLGIVAYHHPVAACFPLLCCIIVIVFYIMYFLSGYVTVI